MDDALEQSEFLAQRFEDITGIPVPVETVQSNARRMWNGQAPEWPEIPELQEENEPGWLSRMWSAITRPFRESEPEAEGPREEYDESGRMVISPAQYDALRSWGMTDEEIDADYVVRGGAQTSPGSEMQDSRIPISQQDYEDLRAYGLTDDEIDADYVVRSP
jgi:hypothetical protein